VTDGKKMEESCSTGQSPQWAVVPMEEAEEEEEEEEEEVFIIGLCSHQLHDEFMSLPLPHLPYCTL
jgi:hypothetical protein